MCKTTCSRRRACVLGNYDGPAAQELADEITDFLAVQSAK
jgi:hypothetical protein